MLETENVGQNRIEEKNEKLTKERKINGRRKNTIGEQEMRKESIEGSVRKEKKGEVKWRRQKKG